MSDHFFFFFLLKGLLSFECCLALLRPYSYSAHVSLWLTYKIITKLYNQFKTIREQNKTARWYRGFEVTKKEQEII